MKSLAAAAALVLLATPALARDPFAASWAGDCHQQDQCWLDIDDPKGGAQKITYTVADRLGTKKLCVIEGTVRREGKALAGTLGGQKVRITGSFAAGIQLSGTDNTACGRPFKVNGRYEVLGD